MEERVLFVLPRRIGRLEEDPILRSVAGAVGLLNQPYTSTPLDLLTLDKHPARVVVCVGKEAFRRVTGLKLSIDTCRGYLFEPSDCAAVEVESTEQVSTYKTERKGKDGSILHHKGDPKMGTVRRSVPPSFHEATKWIIPTLEPLQIRKSGMRAIPALKADLKRAFRASEDRFQPTSVGYGVLPPESEYGRILALDIETDGFSPIIKRIGVARLPETFSGVRAWTSPWGLDAKEALQAQINHAKGIVGHNLAFDLPRLEADGIRLNGHQLFDTMLAASLIQPDLYKGLEKVASLYLDLKPWKHLSEADEERYNATDVGVTLHLALKQINVLHETGMFQLFTEKIMPAVPVLWGMTQRGIKVDRKRSEEWQTELVEKQRELVEIWASFAPQTNPLSPAQVAKHLYTHLGLEEQVGKTGGVTTDESAIKTLFEQYPDHRPMLDTLLRLKKCSKLLGTYAKGGISDDGCVHPSYLPASKDQDRGAAATGRLASSNPNIQNQPPDAKRIFVPHFPGWRFAEADFSQIEVRIAAALSGDTKLQEALKGDLHGVTMGLLGIDRVRAKNFLYGTLYGAGPRKLVKVFRAKGYDLSEAEARTYQDRLARAYPRLWAWRTGVVAEGTARTYLTNSFGRRRYFYGRDKDIPSMIDYLPQSNAADILWSVLPEADGSSRELGGALVTTVHDSLLFEFPEAAIRKSLFVRLGSSLEREFPEIAPGFKVPVEWKVGSSWGEMETWHGES